MRSARRCAALGLALGVLVTGMASSNPPTAGAVEPGAAWDIAQATAPTNLVPGSEASGEPAAAVPRWVLFLTNVGSEVAGPSTVVDLLPPGITVAPGAEPEIAMPNGPNSVEEPCAVSGLGQTVTCEVTRPTSPGELVQIFIPLSIAQDASGTVANQVSVSGGNARPASASRLPTVSTGLPRFGFVPGPGLRGAAFDSAGLAATLAGSHPYMVEMGAEFSTASKPGGLAPIEGLRNLNFNLPAGVIANPAAAPVRCTSAELASAEDLGNPKAGCPVASQVGVVYVEVAGNGRGPDPIYLMDPAPGHSAELAFNYVGVQAHIVGGVGGNLHLTAETRDLLTHFPILGADAFLWGVPSDPSHDPLRYGQGCITHFGCSMGTTSPGPFLTMPSSCTEPIELQGTATSWLGSEDIETRPLADVDGDPIHLGGCGALSFEPTFQAQPTTNLGEHPSGLDVRIHQPQEESLEGRGTAPLKDAEVTLPEGVVLNAAAGNGLAACSEEQIGYAPEGGKVRFSTTAQNCPNAAKVGTFEAETPLLENEVLPGGVYVAKPFENPFGTLLAVYLAIESKKNGIFTKLAGKVEPDPQTGQLTAIFTENPELPIEDIRVHFFEGPNATLTTPLSCGRKTTNATLTPWSTPEGASVNLSDSFETSVGCSSSEVTAPKAVSFSAGTASPLAGAYSPFVLRISRPDGSQHITGVETTLPEGLIGKLAGVAYCPESGIVQAISREAPEKGQLEQQAPSCPATSEVGTVNVTAGSGSAPIPVSGHAYMAGPYKGAPLSVVVIVPAVAGPFDLGTVVDRVALHIDEYTTQVHAVADPLPTIRDGIPVDARSIELRLDRPTFMLNPTSCEVKAIEGEIATQPGQAVSVKNRFQVGECGRLGFKPSLKLSLKGATKKTGHPAVKAVLTYPKKGAYANIARAQVSLPHSEFLDQGSIGKACTKTLIAVRACPSKSIYGKAKAWTPLLDKPLEGPVYLVGGYGYKLPAMVAELNGQLRVLLVGKVDSDKQNGIRNTFEAAPDAPVEKFVLELKGGRRYGLLENSENICRKPQKAGAAFRAQNGRAMTYAVTIENDCKRKGKKSSKGKHRHKKQHR